MKYLIYMEKNQRFTQLLEVINLAGGELHGGGQVEEEPPF